MEFHHLQRNDGSKLLKDSHSMQNFGWHRSKFWSETSAYMHTLCMLEAHWLVAIKTLILSRNVDQKSLETVFLIAICYRLATNGNTNVN